MSIQHVYVHVPFCPAKCDYCAFVTRIGSLKLMDPYLASLKAEAQRWQRVVSVGPLATVYVGGGTPSLMSPVQAKSLLGRIDALFGILPDAEITLEAHPSTLHEGVLEGFRDAGVTRLSFGAESMQRDELLALGRRHDPVTAGRIVAEAFEAGLTSVNVDLMYGIPTQTLQSWQTTLRRTTAARPSHISLYPLQIEPGTVFGKRSRQGTLALPEDRRVVQMYHDACRTLTDSGYEHYEVSNWCLPKHECRHNLACWRGEQCLGLGVGAHGYVGGQRTENIRQTKRYIDAMGRDESVLRCSTPISRAIALSETLMLGLRLLHEGVDLAHIASRYGPDMRMRAENAARPHIAQGSIVQEADRIRLSEQAVPVANNVWMDFVDL